LDITATTATASVVLTALGYEPSTQLLSVPVTYTSLANKDIDVFLVPGVAFTREGARIGRGAGYYDTTLALRGPQAQTVGIAFEDNVVPAVSMEAHDVWMDFIATEKGVLPALRRVR